MSLKNIRELLIESDSTKWMYDEKNNCLITTGAHFKTILDKAEKMSETEMEEGEIKEVRFIKFYSSKI